MSILQTLAGWIRRRKADAPLVPREDLIPGVEVSVGGKTITVPPLNLAQLQKFGAVLSDLESLNEGNVIAQARALGPVIHAALRRNYPTVTLAQVEEMVDLSNLLPLVKAIVTASGLGEPEAGSK